MQLSLARETQFLSRTRDEHLHMCRRKAFAYVRGTNPDPAPIARDHHGSGPEKSIFRIMHDVLARERLPTCPMLRGGVSAAWPTVHGRPQVLHPGRSSLPGQTGVDLALGAWPRADRVVFGIYLI